jgi:ABC-type transport system substrate-binding protein
VYLSYRKVAILTVIIGLALVAGGGFYWYQQVIYTASLDTRPLQIGMVGEINSLQPAQLGSPEERLIASALYEGLVYYDEKADTIKPRLARSWKYSADNKTLTIELKKAKFSNGQSVTAEKVKAAWEKSFSTTKDWANISLFLPIEGSQARLEGRTPDIAGVEAVDSDTLRIRLEKPNSGIFPAKSDLRASLRSLVHTIPLPLHGPKGYFPSHRHVREPDAKEYCPEHPPSPADGK